MEKVSIVKNESYNIDSLYHAVKESLEKIGFQIPHKKTVFIKPNILAQNKPEQHSVTHYSVVDALCRLLKQNECTIRIGDSIAFFQRKLTKKAFRTTKLFDVAKKYNAELVAFDEEPLIRVDENIQVFKELYIPKKLLESDMVIDVCKLKTHGSGLRLTGVIKNMFGCLPGGYKQKIHLWTNSFFDLADVFLDIINIVKPSLYIMDAVIALDGGPSAMGKPVPVGAILSSTNPAALDYVACKIVGYEPEEISVLVRAKKRKMISDYKTVEIIGELPVVRFEKIKKGSIPDKTEGIFITETYVYPRIKSLKCNQCADCIQFCPVNAFIKNDRNKFHIDYEKCIHCYYCISACPKRAIGTKSSFKNKLLRLMRFFLRI